MKRSARLFVVMLGLGVAGGAGAAARPAGSVGPDISNAVRTQKAVGPIIDNLGVGRGEDAEGRGSENLNNPGGEDAEGRGPDHRNQARRR